MNADTYESLLTPPHDLDAEQSVLGGLMLDNGAISKLGGLSEDDFYRQDHRLIFRSIMTLAEEGQPRDVITMSSWLESKKLKEEAGGLAYLATLAKDTPSAANIAHYAEIVREKSTLRQVIELGSNIADSGYRTEGRKGKELIESGMDGLVKMSSKLSRGKKKWVGAKAGVKAALLGIEARSEMEEGQTLGLSSGLHELDEILYGFEKKKMYLIAGRPSMGKSTLAFNIAEHAAVTGKRVAIFSVEMPEQECYSKIMCSMSCVDFGRIKNSKMLTDDDWSRLAPASAKLAGLKLDIDDTGGISPLHIRTALNELIAESKEPVDMVIVDYIQLMGITGGDTSNENALLTSISRDLMALKKDFDCPFLVLSQLNRKVEERPNKRPLQSDLRGSGSLEQDADAIVFVYRDEVYDEESPDKGKAELIVTKNRGGKLGTARVLFKGEHQKFSDFETPYADYPELRAVS